MTFMLIGIGIGLLMIGGPILIDGLVAFGDWFAALPTWGEGIFIICTSIVGFFVIAFLFVVFGLFTR